MKNLIKFSSIAILLLFLSGCSVGGKQDYNDIIKNQQNEIDKLKTAVNSLASSSASGKGETTPQEAKNQIATTTDKQANSSDYKPYITSVVQVSCPQLDDPMSDILEGSGVLIRSAKDNKVLNVMTNSHVLGNPDYTSIATSTKPYEIREYWCQVYTIKNEHDSPVIGSGKTFKADITMNDETHDLALLKIVEIFENNNWRPIQDKDINDLIPAPKACKKGDINMGDRLYILGYPDVGGDTITMTDGIISNFEKGYKTNYIGTSAKINHGNSGGLAIHESGCFLGIPTFAKTGEIESMGYIIDLTIK